MIVKMCCITLFYGGDTDNLFYSVMCWCVVLMLLVLLLLDCYMLINMLKYSDYLKENILNKIVTLIVNNAYLYYRLLTTPMLMERARMRLRNKRNHRELSSDQLLIKNHRSNLWEDSNVLGRHSLVEEISGFKQDELAGTDAACMTAYLEKVMRDGLNHTELATASDFLPAGAPLLDYLAIDLERQDCWKFPSSDLVRNLQLYRGLGNFMLLEVEVKEIVVGVTSNEKVMKIREWLNSCYFRDEIEYPTGTISMDVETICGTRFDILRMAGAWTYSVDRRMRDHPRDYLKDGVKDAYQHFPVKLTVGNGITWALIISLNLGWDGERYILRSNKLQPALLELIEALPVCVGLGVRKKVRDVEIFYSLLAARDVKLKGYLDLSVLATVAGWELSAINMTVMGIQIIGTVLNKCVMLADDLWGVRWAELPASLKIYALGNLKFGYITHLVLAGVMLRNYFPDPDVICRFAQCFQAPIVKWFSDLIWVSLKNTEVDLDMIHCARNRKDLILSIRTRNSENELSPDAPGRVKIWNDLLGQWPSITNGGCKYVLQSRIRFLEQVPVLLEYDIPGSPQLLREPTEDDSLYCQFGMPRSFFDAVVWTEGLSKPGLEMGRPRQIEATLLHVDMDSLGNHKLTRHCHTTDRIQRGLIYEWARMNLDQIDKFIAKLDSDQRFCSWYNTHYETIRLIYQRTTNQPAGRVHDLDAERARKDTELRELEKVMLDRAEEESSIRRQRLARIDKNIELGKVTTPSESTADGGGITLKSVVDHTILYTAATTSWDFSDHINLASGKAFKINGNTVLSATVLDGVIVDGGTF